ncbi:Phosphoglycolate phosphatase [Candidatus Hydrogenisulfobacillus filiaventi]|uniref:Phosphoglycolate phosphatase n=1 Tax=Candidatus Hydrogenisulfobacillus filiaventi TaxID=2707344 RepID=A0A6F8ZKM7_9FIRM|nr:HAD family hydrolase [Bacillota bacterium]CAB1130162.1 Phosphoglycolate phosphatase [Candidatus Hydrogenisulfobacillus filiaventi]
MKAARNSSREGTAISRLIIWDYDGTLAWSLPQQLAAFNAAVVRALGHALEPEAITARFGPPDEGVIAGLVPRARYPEAVREFYETYRRLEPATEVVPELLAFIRESRRQGVHHAVVTNKGRVSATISLRHKGLGPALDAIVTGDDMRAPKPDPDGLEQAIALAARRGFTGSRREVAFVGDSPGDVLAARAAGVVAFWVAYGRLHDRLPPEVVPDGMAETPAALLHLLEAWLAG